ncbi:54S ribosomal protein L4 mitochondrial [Saxophila tyrrhenica]|uniref:Large ribosomal subunit protein uL29m n=1 Tax=Saxophila tyrrhenica TaxID=1690608 RepID=A0AAV9P380_9PEZI|nr:54S ribosomal protein L4 mitochondrial [Saxophila tyrrhenica]
MHCTSKALLTGAFGPALRRSSTVPPAFLLPSFSATYQSAFSTTTSFQARKDGNPNRGVSALRRTGLNKRQRATYPLVPKDGPVVLPKPVLDPEQRSAIEVDENHGLWDFFNVDRDSLFTPTQLAAHGRGWSVQELRRKDWEDLHRLWWVCVKEKNRVDTFKKERERVGTMYGDYEADERMKEIRVTMRSIKFVLTERWYAWENARNVAMQDDEVNLYANPDEGERAYLPAGSEQPEMQMRARRTEEQAEDAASSEEMPPPTPEAERREPVRV